MPRGPECDVWCARDLADDAAGASLPGDVVHIRAKLCDIVDDNGNGRTAVGVLIVGGAANRLVARVGKDLVRGREGIDCLCSTIVNLFDKGVGWHTSNVLCFATRQVEAQGFGRTRLAHCARDLLALHHCQTSAGKRAMVCALLTLWPQ